MSSFPENALLQFNPGRFFHKNSATQRAAVAVSACLAGEKVRYDGAAKLLSGHAALQGALDLISVCPEVGAGLGVPRPPVQLVRLEQRICARGRDDARIDVTLALEHFAQTSLRHLTSSYRLCGYLFKSRSPSCGLESTPLFAVSGSEIAHTSGIQADYFQRHLPYLSYREDTDLASEDSVAQFVLLCRLVFDLLHASNAPLNELHRHYPFLQSNFDTRIIENLEECNRDGDRRSYLAAFLKGCSQMPEKILLDLFR